MAGSLLKESLIAHNTLIDNDVGISLAETAETTVIDGNIVLQNNGKPCVGAPNGDISVVKPQWRNNTFFGAERKSFAWPKPLDFDEWRALTRCSGCEWAAPKLPAPARR
jgi:hypothetical protein